MITPRKDEKDAVVAVLESDEYPDAPAMAGALVKTVVAQLAGRGQFWLVTLQGACVGPFYSETDAARWAKRTEAEHGVKGTIIPAWTEQVYDLTDDMNTNAACECGHAREQHVVTGAKNKPSKPKECGVISRQRERCQCAGYSARKKG